MPVPGQVMDGAVCSFEMLRRTAIKHPPGTPARVIICVPIGTKLNEQIFQIPVAGKGGCEDPECKCFFHGKELSRPVRNQGLVPLEWAMNQMQLTVPLNTTLGYLAEKNRYSGPARDDMTKRAMDLGCEFIFYWDDDVVLPAQALYEMLIWMERDSSIGLLTGVVCTREDPTEPLIYKEHGKGAWWDFSIDPEDPPEDIFAAGGGCLLVRVEALKKMTPPYWQDVQEDRSLWGHDIRFISNLRRESGFRTCVKGSVLCGHWDVERQKYYELPRNSRPFLALKNKRPSQPVWTVEDSGELTLPYVWKQLTLSDGERRMYLVEKAVQSDQVVSEVLSKFYGKVQVVSVDSRWLGIGEDLKDGWNHALVGDPASSGQLGDDHGANGGNSA